MTNTIPVHVPGTRPRLQFLRRSKRTFIGWKRLHDGPGVIWVPTAAHGGPAWVFTRHALIAEGFTDCDTFSSKRGANAAVMDSSWLLLPVEADRPDHRYYRQLLVPFFSPSAIAGKSASEPPQTHGRCFGSPPKRDQIRSVLKTRIAS